MSVSASRDRRGPAPLRVVCGVARRDTELPDPCRGRRRVVIVRRACGSILSGELNEANVDKLSASECKLTLGTLPRGEEELDSLRVVVLRHETRGSSFKSNRYDPSLYLQMSKPLVVCGKRANDKGQNAVAVCFHRHVSRIAMLFHFTSPLTTLGCVLVCTGTDEET